MTKLSGKTVLITGGAMGLGKLMARSSVKQNAGKVILWDINEQALEQTAGELRQAGNSEIFTHIANVSDPDQINSVGQKVLNEIGAVDVLFNNAGIVAGKQYFHEHSTADIENTMRINVNGVMHVTRVFLPAMINQKSGHVVNVASAAGLIPNPNMSVYCASKWAITGWSESLRLEMEKVKSGVKVTTFAPGYINTGMFDGVKSPLMTPILEPDNAINTLMKAVNNDRAIIRMPFMVKALPLLRGLMPTRLFDFAAGEIFGVYKTMDTFKGRN